MILEVKHMVPFCFFNMKKKGIGNSKGSKSLDVDMHRLKVSWF